MLKIFLVEDEFVVRKGIKNNVEWEKHGYEFAGEASDGELAYPMIIKMRPDIVITDIKMPFMNGLELTKLIKKNIPSTEVLILTGHEEFEYAKEAISLGVAGYLLKPISGDELLAELGKLSEKINSRREEELVREKLVNRFMSGDARTEIAETERKNEYTVEDFDAKSIDTRLLGKERMLDFIKLGEKEGVRNFVDEFCAMIGETAFKSNMFRQYVTMDAYFTVCDFVDKMGEDKEEIRSFDVRDGILESEDSSKEYIISIISKAIELREKNSGSKYRDVIDEVLKFIEKNYADDELSLNIVAAHVNFSPNHLSAVFSQKTGQPFIKYLIDYRMKKAKELLKGTAKKSSEISSEVGYKDPHYFSYLFKKTTGMTPTQYRGQLTEEM